MKRYMLFAGQAYEQAGGIYDLKLMKDNAKELYDDLLEMVPIMSQHGDKVWWHIYDAAQNKIIAEGIRRRFKMNNGLKEYQEKLRNGEIEKPRKKSPLEKSQEDPTSKAKAIIAKCYDCVYDPCDKGSWKEQVRQCTCEDCPLYSVRPR